MSCVFQVTVVFLCLSAALLSQHMVRFQRFSSQSYILLTGNMMLNVLGTGMKRFYYME